MRLESFSQLQQRLKRGTGKVGEALVDCVNIYIGFIHRRFLKFASGGGDWRKLKKSYVRQKAADGFDRRILIRTGLLESQLRVGVARVIKRGTVMSVGFTRSRAYPSGVKVATVLVAHDRGLGVVPKRQIIVPPDLKTEKRITSRVERAFKESLR